MRKILASVLGVAGLLAVILAVSTGPATAQVTVVETFQTDNDPGTYTVSWATSGGCDPNKPGDGSTLATDGAVGSKSVTVDPLPTTAANVKITDGATPGHVADNARKQVAVTIGSHCKYTWKASFTSGLVGSQGIRCAIRANNTTANTSGVITLDETAALHPLSVEADYTGRGDTNGKCTVMGTIKVDIPRGATDPTSGAVLHSDFTVTATPAAKHSSKLKTNEECGAVTEITEVDKKNTNTTSDDTVGAELTVLKTPLNQPAAQSSACEYDVTFDLPGGFDHPGDTYKVKTRELEADAFTAEEIIPTSASKTAPVNGVGQAAAETLAAADCGTQVWVASDGSGSATAADNTVAKTVKCRFNFIDLSFAVTVGSRDVYVLQNVVGDAGGANATYTLTSDAACGIPSGLPKALEPTPGTGGIQTSTTTVVELAEGLYNISGAVIPNAATPGAPAQRLALNEEADQCDISVAVKGLPAHCAAAATPESVNLVDGLDARERAIIRFDITCEQSEPEPADDGGDMMDDGGDDMMDDGGDDGGDDMMDDGPMMDAPTG